MQKISLFQNYSHFAQKIVGTNLEKLNLIRTHFQTRPNSPQILKSFLVLN